MKWNKITLVDQQLLDANEQPDTSCTAREPGSTLPFDFPRGEFTDDQLVLLEELCFQYTREFILRFFRVLATPLGRDGQNVTSNVCNVAVQAIVLSKLLGLNEEMSWKELAATFGCTRQTVMYAKAQAVERLDRLATRGTRTAEEWQALAELARRQARLYTIKAASLRQQKKGARKKPKNPDLPPIIPADLTAGN